MAPNIGRHSLVWLWANACHSTDPLWKSGVCHQRREMSPEKADDRISGPPRRVKFPQDRCYSNHLVFIFFPGRLSPIGSVGWAQYQWWRNTPTSTETVPRAGGDTWDMSPENCSVCPWCTRRCHFDNDNGLGDIRAFLYILWLRSGWDNMEPVRLSCS